MLDPAGDSKHVLREIDGAYEYALSMQCAELIKRKLEQECHDVRIILTRVPGESMEPLQTASFANRLAVDLFVRIHFYWEKEAKSQLFLYYYCGNPVTDAWKKANDILLFIPVDQAHLQHRVITQEWAATLCSELEQQEYSQYFECKGYCGVPLKSLVGIVSPALCIEAGLKTKKDISVYANCYVDALSQLIRKIRVWRYE